MAQEEINDNVISVIAEHINKRNNRPSNISIATITDETETPHYFEIVPFNEIDKSENTVFAVDGSYSSQEFYNGLSIGVYAAGYVGYFQGSQLKLNDSEDPLELGKSYYPQNVLITNDEHLAAIYDELLQMKPVQDLFDFFDDEPTNILSFDAEIITSTLSKLLSFCQEILEWALVYEISNLKMISPGDIILRDGPLRSNNIRQAYLVKLGRHLKEKKVLFAGITKNSPIKLELASSFKKIDNYLQDDYKHKYPFNNQDPKWQKLCCWFEVPDNILLTAYPEAKQKQALKAGMITVVNKTSMYANKGLTGGRGIGVFFVARLDYVEKLQNYDWIVADLNIFDVMPGIDHGAKKRDIELIHNLFYELTRLTQEHYILGYPYPLVEANSFISIKDHFKGELIKRIKYALYHDQRMDQVDIENLFLDITARF